MSDLRALIIEDSPSDTDVLRSLLARQDIQCTVIADGRIATHKLSELDPPDLIFLDLEIPGLNGYEVLEQIHALPDLNHIPVVAYTSHNSEMVHAREAGFHSFLGKPLRGGQFADYLQQILNDNPVWVVR